MSARFTRRVMVVVGVVGLAGAMAWLGFLGLGAGAFGAVRREAGDLGTVGAPSATLTTRSLVIPAMQPLIADDQLVAAQEAAWDGGRAFMARWRSRTEFDNLGAASAARVAVDAFPAAIGQRAGGTPALPAGDQIARYLRPDAAQLALPDRKHAVIESIGAMATKVAPGRFAPIDLGLKQTGDGYVPTSSDAAVQIPKRISAGVVAPTADVSLTPVDTQGRALTGAEGAIDGASVLYANTQTDADTVAKPTTSGFELSTILRSVASPHTLYYRVGVPAGARLVQERNGVIHVVRRNGVAAGTVASPTAEDAAGVAVPVTMRIAGDVLVLDVASSRSEHQWPIDVDPEFKYEIDETLAGRCFEIGFLEDACGEGHRRWKFLPESSEPFVGEWCYCGAGSGYIKWRPNEHYNGGEVAGIKYETQGESRIYHFETTSEGTYTSPAQVYQEILTHEGHEKTNYYDELPAETGHYATTGGICAHYEGPEKCEPSAGTPGNEARFLTFTTSEGGAEAFFQNVSKAYVWIAQEKGPELSFNTEAPDIEYKGTSRHNVLYGNGSWLGPYTGSLEVKAVDPGVGVSRFEANIDGYWVGGREMYAEGLCEGIQCSPTYSTPLTYNERMPDGEPELEINASDGVGWGTYNVKHKVKVDSEPPYNIKISGLPASGELSATQHTVTVEATDGKQPTPSSGVQSIAVKIDGGEEAVIPGTSCSPGECTAKGQYTIDAESLTEGVHKLVVTATDNANNVAPAKEFTFDVRDGTPVSVGPGTVSPTTGQFQLGATDVSLGGISGVSRVYQSRNLTAGAGGPLGPQWSLNLGASEGLAVLPEGSVVVRAVNGGVTTFLHKSDGEFESPPGDSNLKVVAKEETPGKGITEYLVKDTSAGSTTHFTQPPGTEKTTPLFAAQFGKEFSPHRAPLSDAIDASGNMWVTDPENNRIEKYTPDGALIAAYGPGTPGRREFDDPWGIAVNQATGDVYVTDRDNNRVEELNSEGVFIAAFGWGVTNGRDEFEICKEKCKTGLVGSGPGEFDSEAGIAVDASGNVWVADYGNHRIQEFNAEGQYLKTISNEQLFYPTNIAPVGDELYVVNNYNNAVDEISMTGVLEREWGHLGNGQGEFDFPFGIAADPRNGDLYVTDSYNNRIQEFNDSGEFITQFGSSGSAAGQVSEPTGIAVSSNGGIYVADYKNDRLEEWMRSSWLPTVSEGTLKSGTTERSYEPVEVEEGKTLLLPHEVSAPAPVGISCGTNFAEMKKGCRALVFEYAHTTSASLGEAPGEWGEYRGRLMKVLFVGYNPAEKVEKMEEKAVAEYAYDKQGRLRAEWDPRIEPALKTTYGYDSEDHVVAVSPPGQEPWLLRYGALDGDPNTGRLLSVTRPAAATPTTVKEQAELPAPTNESAPTLSGGISPGDTLTATKGTWVNKPLVYSYQWESCLLGIADLCHAIIGAVNESYTVRHSNSESTLRVRVTAENAAGGQTAISGDTGLVPEAIATQPENPPPMPPSVGNSSVYTIEYGVPLSGEGLPTMSKEELARWGQTKDLPVEGMAVFPPDTPMGWPAKSYKRATITYLDEEARAVNVTTPDGGISTTEYNETDEVDRTLSADNRATALKSGKTIEATAAVADTLDTENKYDSLGQLVESLGPEHKVRLAHGKKTDEEVKTRAHVVYSYDEGAPSRELYDLVTKTTSGAQTAKGEFDQRTTVTSYSGQNGLGWTLRKPTSVTVDPGGLGLTTTTRYDKTTGNAIETIPPGNAQTLLPLYATQFGKQGTASGEVDGPSAIALDADENIWVADTGNNRIDEFSSEGVFLAAFGWGVDKGADNLEECTSECRAGIAGGKGELSSPEGITYDPADSSLYVSTGNDQILQFSKSTKGKPEVKAYGKEGTGKLEFDSPEGLTIAANGDIWVADKSNHRLEEITDKGKYVGEAGVGKGEYSDVTLCDGKLYAADAAGQHIDEVGTETKETILNTFGKEGKENGQFTQIARIACDPQNHDLYATDAGSDRVDIFSDTGTFVNAFGSKGSEPGDLNTPLGIAITASNVTYIDDSENNRVSVWSGGGTNGPGTHGVRTVYYTAEGESEVSGCRDHPEWADLVCQTEPIVQPETAGIPDLPVTSYTYNIWDEIVDTKEAIPASKTFGAVTRDKLETYDQAGRPETSETKSKPAHDAKLPPVTNKYNEATGMLEKQSAPKDGETTSVYNTVGQLEKYTDAAGNTTKYEYEEGGDARLTGIEDGKGSQSYVYNMESGELEKLIDSSAGTFSATYDAEGKMLTETYPNNMTAKYTYNALGAAAGIEYVKNADCATKCPEKWFSDTTVPSIHGEMLEQTSTLATENYTYDEAGRLTETQEIPAGKDCVTRLYTYDEESNRTSLTTRQSTSSICATEGGESEDHTYDSANRLDDPGIEYEELGNITTLPKADAGGHELTATYYVDGQVQSQTQKKETLNYRYDPAGRTLETTSEGKVEGTTIAHYPGPGEAISWTSEGEATWTRNIPGIDGALSATETSAGAVTLQLHDLKGDIVATAAKSESETKLLTTYNSTEFGVPNEGKAPPKYAWLGATGVSTETAFESGVATQGGASYVPQIARTLQTAQVIPPGAFPDGAPGTPETSTISAASLASAEAEGKQIFAEVEAARQKAREEEAREAEEAACEANPQACSEDPPWSSDVSIGAAEAISGAVEGLEIAYYLGGASIAEKVGAILKEDLGVNFISKIEEAVEKRLFGFSVAEVVNWVFAVGNLLDTCAENASDGALHPKNPHCWIYMKTEVVHPYKGAPGIEIPNFSFIPDIGYCPWGTYSACYIINYD
jgi:YD repeat-containing protein